MKKAEKFWDKRATDFKSKVVDSESSFGKSIAKALLHLNKESNVLDIGCATGALAFTIADKVNNVVGIDISSKMIQLGSEQLEQNTISNVSFKHKSVFEVSKEDGEFSSVLAFNVLHLLDDKTAAICKIYEILPKGGLFISSTPCRNARFSWSNLLFSLLTGIGVVPHLKILKASELEDLLTDCEFQIMESIPSATNPMNYFVVAQKK